MTEFDSKHLEYKNLSYNSLSKFEAYCLSWPCQCFELPVPVWGSIQQDETDQLV